MVSYLAVALEAKVVSTEGQSTEVVDKISVLEADSVLLGNPIDVVGKFERSEFVKLCVELSLWMIDSGLQGPAAT